MPKLKKQHKACQGCRDHFTTYRNYDYCKDCAVNGNRYVVRNSPCSECDGSGWIKFPGQPKRPCKLCYLTKTMPKTAKLTKEEKYWDQVNQLSQEKIYQLFTKNIPFQNIPLITEPWKFEDKQQKLTGLFLRRDVDYRTLLSDMSNQYGEENLPDQEYLVEEIALEYCRMVVKSLIESVSDYSCYDPSYFENLIPND